MSLVLGTTLLLIPSSASALTMNVLGLGLDVGNICLSTAGSCSGEATFTLTPTVTATGSYEYTPGGGGLGTIAIELDLDDFSMTGSGPDGVDEIAFTNIHLSVLSWNTFEVGSDIQGLGFANLTVTGFYEQLDGGVQLVAPQSLDQVVQASNLVCPLSGVGQCGFSLAARDFQLSVGTSNAESHDVTWTLNTLVPEPSTATLLVVGLCLTGLARRRQS